MTEKMKEIIIETNDSENKKRELFRQGWNISNDELLLFFVESLQSFIMGIYRVALTVPVLPGNLFAIHVVNLAPLLSIFMPACK